jgi:hypothetical protein
MMGTVHNRGEQGSSLSLLDVYRDLFSGVALGETRHIVCVGISVHAAVTMQYRVLTVLSEQQQDAAGVWNLDRMKCNHYMFRTSYEIGTPFGSDNSWSGPARTSGGSSLCEIEFTGDPPVGCTVTIPAREGPCGAQALTSCSLEQGRGMLGCGIRYFAERDCAFRRDKQSSRQVKRHAQLNQPIDSRDSLRRYYSQTAYIHTVVVLL